MAAKERGTSEGSFIRSTSTFTEKSSSSCLSVCEKLVIMYTKTSSGTRGHCVSRLTRSDAQERSSVSSTRRSTPLKRGNGETERVEVGENEVVGDLHVEGLGLMSQLCAALLVDFVPNI